MKTQDDDLLVYDEDDAVKFILNYIPAESKATITDEKVEYVLDVVYDYYEESGLIEEDSTDEANIDEAEMFDFIMKASKKQNMELTEEEVALILEGEYEYGKSLGIYTNED